MYCYFLLFFAIFVLLSVGCNMLDITLSLCICSAQENEGARLHTLQYHIVYKFIVALKVRIFWFGFWILQDLIACLAAWQRFFQRLLPRSHHAIISILILLDWVFISQLSGFSTFVKLPRDPDESSEASTRHCSVGLCSSSEHFSLLDLYRGSVFLLSAFSCSQCSELPACFVNANWWSFPKTFYLIYQGHARVVNGKCGIIVSKLDSEVFGALIRNLVVGKSMSVLHAAVCAL